MEKIRVKNIKDKLELTKIVYQHMCDKLLSENIITFDDINDTEKLKSIYNIAQTITEFLVEDSG